MKEIVLVIAMAENGVIGKNGVLPWHISQDLKRLKALTMGHTVVMGRKTWDSLPKKPLPGRLNVVVSRQQGWQAQGALRAASVEEAIAAGSQTVMVLGGAGIYRQALGLATRIELTEVHRAFDGDVHFGFDRSCWRESMRAEHVGGDGLRYSYVTLERS